RDAGEDHSYAQLETEEDAPAERPEPPLGHVQDQADRDQDSEEEHDADDDADQDRDLLDLVADLGKFGLGQVDVARDEPLSGVLRGTQLLTKPRRLGAARVGARSGIRRGARLIRRRGSVARTSI